MDHATRLNELATVHGRYQSKFVRRFAAKSRFPRPIVRGQVWESYFMRKSRYEKQTIIQQPWIYPMAAQNLASILIQKYVRGMLVRMHKDTSPNSCKVKPSFLSPIQRFIQYGNGSFTDDNGFRYFTATVLQSWYRMVRLRWRYNLQRCAVYHIAALQIQYTWKAQSQHRMTHAQGISPHSLPTRQEKAALILQATWKRYTQARIYHYYRDLLSFRGTGDPGRMLRAINPSEAGLLDTAMGAHVRFRLGGLSFPPTIYYKIYTSRAVCDLNAFSPKDYALERQEPSNTDQKHAIKPQKRWLRVGNAYYRVKQQAYDTSHWYKRLENNGWRPVTAKVMAEALADPVYVETSKKEQHNYHYSRLVRKEDLVQQRRIRKREWMVKLYTQGMKRQENDMKDQKLAKTENEDWEEKAEEMFEWASSLDYDQYLENWHQLGQTASTDNQDTEL